MYFDPFTEHVFLSEWLHGVRYTRVTHSTRDSKQKISLVEKESIIAMEKSIQGVGRCKFSFWFAVFHDVLGLLILLSGVFWDIFFNDLLIYSGAVVIFLSLIWWVFWYTGNIEVPPKELEDDVTLYRRTKGISGVVRKVSDRLSNGLSSFRRSGRGNVPKGNSHQELEKGPISTNICMISYTNTQALGPSNNLNREPLCI